MAGGAIELKRMVPTFIWTLKKNKFPNFVELRRAFPHSDQVGGLTVFNIGGNKARLIAAMHYNRGKVYIRAVLTHAEYDTNRWKER